LGKTQEIEELVERELDRLAIELVEVEYRRENKEQLLRILIDSEAGVDLNLCSQATRAIKPILDDRNIYYDHLELSSPGLDRILRKDKDFLRFRGSMVKIKMLKPYQGPGKIKGILVGNDETRIQVEVGGEVMDLPREMVSRVRLYPDY
jgi:ribosome maturation factor RimP